MQVQNLSTTTEYLVCIYRTRKDRGGRAPGLAGMCGVSQSARVPTIQIVLGICIVRQATSCGMSFSLLRSMLDLTLHCRGPRAGIRR